MAEKKYYDLLDQEVQEASGGGGMVCQVANFPAFEIYCKLSPVDRTFTYATVTEKAVAKEKANKLAQETGLKVQKTIVMILYKDSVLGRDVSHWKGDLHRSAGVRFGPDAKELLEKHKELGMKTGVRAWARTSSIVSPNCEENQDKDWAWEADTRTDAEPGAKQLKRLHLPFEVFANKAAAEVAAESSEGFVDTSNIPQAWLASGGQAPDWLAIVPEIEAEFGKKSGLPVGVAVTQLANSYGVTSEDIAKTLGVDISGLSIATAHLNQ